MTANSCNIFIFVVDSDYQLIDKDIEISAFSKERNPILLEYVDNRWIAKAHPNERIYISIFSKDFEPEEHVIYPKSENTQIIIGLRKPGQISYNYGDSKLAFTPMDDAFLLRIRGENAFKKIDALTKKMNIKWKSVLATKPRFNDDGLIRISGNVIESQKLIQQFRDNNLKTDIFRTIEHGDRTPIGLGNEIIVRFESDVKQLEVEKIAKSIGLQIVRELTYAGNSFILASKDEPSYDILKSVEILLHSISVVYAEPNLTFTIKTDGYTPNDPLWSQLSHLQLMHVDDAWDLLDSVSVDIRGGSSTITIGIIDPQGITPDHPDLTDLTANLTDGTSKLIASMNFASWPIIAQTVRDLDGDHGTQCAGSATAAFDNNQGITGVAPNCHLIGAKIGDITDTALIPDVFKWMAGFPVRNSTPGFPSSTPSMAADIISCSIDTNGIPLSNAMRDCFDFLTTYGRGGKGCILCFSIGNTGYNDFTIPTTPSFRAFPTYEKTIAVGASINSNPTNPVLNSNDPDPSGHTTNIATAVDTRALYSPYGATALRKPDLVAPSNTAFYMRTINIDPIPSVVQKGSGTIDGCPGAPVPCRDYSTSFGGTSHAAPTVAGATALILSARPDLSWIQVREILRQTCVRIDRDQTNTIGHWQDLDGDGSIDYSRWYGAGRIDVNEAVALALDPALLLADVYVRDNLSDSGGVPSSGDWWASPDIWVTKDSITPIPSLAWTDPAPHENPERGHDNAVFCRVSNRGNATAPVVYVRAMITHWPGLEFVYPNDFIPSIKTGDPIPSPLMPATYFIGEIPIHNLLVGANEIVKFVWQQALIPPETVMVSGVPVRWHPCLLVEASPHDGPTPVTGLSVPIKGDNNIAQRNIHIVNHGDSESDAYIGTIVGTRDKKGISMLILDVNKLQDVTALNLHFDDEKIMKSVWSDINQDKTFSASMIKHKGIDAIKIKGILKQIEIPLKLRGEQFIPLIISIEGQPIGDLYITQRRGDEQLSEGYGINWNKA
jgi:subtilisin family serine protease